MKKYHFGIRSVYVYALQVTYQRIIMISSSYTIEYIKDKRR